MLHHLSLAIADLPRATRFYDPVLATLGWVRLWNAPLAAGYGPDGGGDRLALRQDAAARAPAHGFHLALAARSAEAVQAFHAAALANGGSDDGAPGPRPHYGSGYFAAFVSDPDGHRLEVVLSEAAAQQPASAQPRLMAVAYLVRDYDAAIAWFTHALGFDLVEDSPREAGKRWVLVQPRGGGTRLLLARAANDVQLAALGAQAGGRVFLFLQVEDFAAEHAALQARGVRFLEQPRCEAYGWVAVFEDLYGQRWDLLGPSAAPG